MKLKRKYYNYKLWEDIKHGMYKVPEDKNKQELIDKAQLLLSQPYALFKAMKHCTTTWKISCQVNFTNPSCNHQAWLGQAACCFKHRVPENLVREAWNKLQPDQQIAANTVADILILDWRERYERGLKKCLKK
jgi:hypothetical protein